MRFRAGSLCLGTILSISAAFGQAADTPYQVRYVANLNIADAAINVSNTGASSTVAFPVQNGTLCANVYAYAPDASLVSCCACQMPANTVRSLSVKQDILTHVSSPPPVPTSLIIKLLATTGSGGVCSPSTAGTGANVLATGMVAHTTTVHNIFPAVPGTKKNDQGSAAEYGVTETPFTPSTLSAAELTRMTTLCGTVLAQNGGVNICNACRTGALSQTRD